MNSAFGITAIVLAFVGTTCIVTAVAVTRKATSSCHESSTLAAVGGQTLPCDRSATASFHDTPHGVVLTCTCPTKEKKP